MAADRECADVCKKWELCGRKLIYRAAECNGVSILKQLLSERSDDVDLKNQYDSALLSAVYSNKGASHYESIKVLLEHGTNVNAQDDDGDTALHHVLHSFPAVKTIELLLSFNADLSLKNNKGETSLFNAVGDNLEILQLLTDRGADVNVTNNDGETPLHQASRGKRVPMIIKLLSLGSNIDAINKLGQTPLHVAAYESENDSFLEVIRIMLENKAKVNVQDHQGKTLLHYLIPAKNEKPNVKTVELILSFRVNVNLKDADGKTPLTIAANNGNAKIRKLLFDHGAIANGKNEWYEAALHKVTRNNDATLIKRILSQKVKIDERDTYERTSLHLAAFKCKGDWYFESIQVLLKHQADVNAQDKEGKTPLHYLVMNPGNVKTVQLLLNCKADINAKDGEGQTPLILSKDAEYVQLLVDQGADIDARQDSGETALHKTAKSNNLPMIIKLATLGADVNILDSSGKTALHLATEENRVDSHHDIIEVLLKNKANFNVYDGTKRSPLYNLVESNSSVETVQLLLNYKSAVNVEYGNELVPLIAAVNKGNSDIVELLIDRGADISGKIEYYGSALHVAARKNNVPLVEKLLSLRADVNVRSEDGSTPLHFAACRNNNVSQPETIEILLINGADVNAQNIHGCTPLYNSLANTVDTKSIEILLNNNADVNIRTNEGETPIFGAIINDANFKVIELLMNHRPDLDYVNPETGRTVLHEACKRDLNFCKIELLLKNGADVNARNHKGQTPIFYFMKSKHFSKLECIKLLSSYKADLNVKDNNGHTPLSVALRHHNEDSVRLIVKLGAEVNYIVRNEPGLTPLLEVCIFGWGSRTIEAILKNGAQVNVKDSDGETPISILVYEADVEKIQLLLSYKADITLKNREGETPLIKALNDCKFRLAKLFIDYDPKCINDRRKDGFTPLHFACFYRNSEMIELLLKNGAQVDARMKNGSTPLYCLTWQKINLEAVESLLRYKPDVNAVDNKGRTALFYAVTHGNSDMIQLLVDRGSDVNVVAQHGITLLHKACQSIYTALNVDLLKILLKNGVDANARDSKGWTPIMYAFKRGIKSKETLVFLLKYFDVNVFHNGKNVLNFDESSSIWKIVLMHFAKIQALDFLVQPSVLNMISNNKEYEAYFEMCVSELTLAKSCKLKNSWVTYFNLLVDSKKKLKNYAGNEDLIEDFKNNKCIRKFPLYGEQMRKNLEKGLKRRELYDESSVLLSNCLLNLNPTHLVVRDILDCVSTKELAILCE